MRFLLDRKSLFAHAWIAGTSVPLLAMPGTKRSIGTNEMAALERFTAILSLFRHEQTGAWTVPDMAAALNAPVSTVYRHVRELTQAGFLEQGGEAHYRLGPAFIEYERLLRLGDPLSQRAPAILLTLIENADAPALAILARLYNGEVMCIASSSAPDAAFTSSYERGRPMPLTRGATSKVILAQLPSRNLKTLIGPREANTILRNELSQIRRDGFFVTSSEIDTGLAGIAVPVATGEARITASLTLVVRESILNPQTNTRLIKMAQEASSQLAGKPNQKANFPCLSPYDPLKSSRASSNKPHSSETTK